jgi:hypothetical protein
VLALESDDPFQLVVISATVPNGDDVLTPENTLAVTAAPLVKLPATVTTTFAVVIGGLTIYQT